VLKIDRLFVQGLRTDPGNAIVVQAMVSLAHALGLSVVAEGVETTAQLHALKGFGCDLVQGFLISEPLPASLVAGLLDAREPARAVTA
jgi:EAL domain-containing protein (putative c-di-GMP-specific phosphodiesterase class I)